MLHDFFTQQPQIHSFSYVLQALTELRMKTPTNQWLKKRGGADAESKNICGDRKSIFSIKWKKDHVQTSNTCNSLSSLNLHTELAAGAYEIDNSANYSNRYVLQAFTALRR